MSDLPHEGDIWRYSYLWRWQDKRGETEGRKDRPISFVAIASSAAGSTLLFILPITSQEPNRGTMAIEIPQTEIHRAGLDADKRLWLILDEFNLDVLEHSHYFEPSARIGSFSTAFRAVAIRAFRKCYLAKRAKAVRRFHEP